MSTVYRLACFVCLFTSQTVFGDSPNVVVFTTSYLPVEVNAGQDVIYYELDVADQVIDNLSGGLSSEASVAERQALERIESSEGIAALHRMQTSFEGAVLAWQLGVTELPAVMVNGDVVVVGVMSVEEAVSIATEDLKK